jgi:predicted nucleic acid-binding protein
VTLIDSSVWIDHWRRGNAKLSTALEIGRVAAHPFVIGELACGTLPSRASTLRLLNALPKLPPARHEEVMTLVEAQRLWGSGLGWIDAHLLAASMVSGVPLWTLDRALRQAAERLGVYQEPEAS